MKDPLLFLYTPKGQTVKWDSYCELLWDLKPKIKTKRRGKLSKVVILLQDNARSYSVGKRSIFGFELLEYPPNSPDLAPSDFYLFHMTKEHLRKSECLYEAVRERLCTKLLPGRNTKRIEVEGEMILLVILFLKQKFLFKNMPLLFELP